MELGPGDGRNSVGLGNEKGQDGGSPNPYSRPLGQTEQNWFRAVKSGTGNTVVGLLFARRLRAQTLQVAVDEVLVKHPRLRSRLVQVHGRLLFQVSDSPLATVQVFQCPETSDDGEIQTENEIASNGIGVDLKRNPKHRPGHPHEHLNTPPNGHEMWEDAVENFVDCDPHEDDSNPQKDDSNDPKDPLPFQQDKNHDEQPTDAKELDDAHGVSESAHADWFRIVENELNVSFPTFQDKNDQKQIELFEVKLFELGRSKSVVIIRAHTSICDRAAAGEICVSFLRVLDRELNGTRPSDELTSSHCQQPFSDPCYLPCVEDLIPRGKAHKPFWAHGKDILGYGLGSRRHACLFFQDYASPRHSELIRSSLTKEETNVLLRLCEEKKTNLYGILSASALKACAMSKKLGNRGEHFAICSLIDCRSVLSPPLSSSTVGFYHSALMNAHVVKEGSPTWQLARQCYSCLEDSIKRGKHFSDLNDLNMLMAQAIHHPRLTPYSSLRTSLLCLFRGSLQQNMQELGERLLVEDSIGCSSVHGVGPCMAIFDSIQHDGLHMAHVYPAPLFSRSQMQEVVNHMIKILKDEIYSSVQG